MIFLNSQYQNFTWEPIRWQNPYERSDSLILDGLALFAPSYVQDSIYEVDFLGAHVSGSILNRSFYLDRFETVEGALNQSDSFYTSNQTYGFRLANNLSQTGNYLNDSSWVLANNYFTGVH